MTPFSCSPVEVPLKDELRQIPSPVERLVRWAVRIWSSVFAIIRLSQNFILANWINEQFMCLGLFEHPFERNLREPALGLTIASTDVAVHTRKPHLLQIFRSMRAGGIRAWTPQIVAEECTMLINRNGVPSELDVRIV